MYEAQKVARLEQILEATAEGWWEWDIRTNTTYHSEGWFKMLGYSAGEFSSSVDMWLGFVHPADRERIFSEQNIAIRQNEAWEIEFRMKTAAGTYIWVLSRGRVMERDEDGKASKVAGIHINIQHRKELEMMREESARQEEMMKGILRVSFSSMSIYDYLQKKVIFSQWLIFKKLGYTEGEFEQLSRNFFRQIIHPDDLPFLHLHLQKIQQAGPEEVIECVVRFRSKQGDYHWIAVRDSIFQVSESGEIGQLIGSAVDVTRYKELKQQIDENLQTLKSLSYRNSHELRAPVASIMGLLSLIRHELKTEGAIQELIHLMQEMVDKLDEVIHDFGKALS